MSRPTNDLRRLGTILLLGVIAGYGVRYVASRVSRNAADRPNGLIDSALHGFLSARRTVGSRFGCTHSQSKH